jgi:aromatic ring-opening dioxygenase LigB subunit
MLTPQATRSHSKSCGRWNFSTFRKSAGALPFKFQLRRDIVIVTDSLVDGQNLETLSIHVQTSHKKVQNMWSADQCHY